MRSRFIFLILAIGVSVQAFADEPKGSVVTTSTSITKSKRPSLAKLTLIVTADCQASPQDARQSSSDAIAKLKDTVAASILPDSFKVKGFRAGQNLSTDNEEEGKKPAVKVCEAPHQLIRSVSMTVAAVKGDDPFSALGTLLAAVTDLSAQLNTQVNTRVNKKPFTDISSPSIVYDVTPDEKVTYEKETRLEAEKSAWSLVQAEALLCDPEYDLTSITIKHLTISSQFEQPGARFEAPTALREFRTVPVRIDVDELPFTSTVSVDFHLPKPLTCPVQFSERKK